MKGREIKFVKVKSHVGIWYNDFAYRKATEGVKKDKSLILNYV